ncbi:uncharacterized protein M6D78_013402 [Vipera latastei]
MLIHHFRAGLDDHLQRACIVRGIPPRLQEWFRVVVELDVGLQGCQRRAKPPADPRQAPQKSQGEGQKLASPMQKPTGPPPRAAFRCFRCDQPGHRVADCPMPAPRAVAGATPARGVTSPRFVEQSRANRQALDTTPRRNNQAETERPTDVDLEVYGDGDGQEEDPMMPLVFLHNEYPHFSMEN